MKSFKCEKALTDMLLLSGIDFLKIVWSRFSKYYFAKIEHRFIKRLRGFSEGDPKRPVGDAFSGIEENVFCTDNNCDAPKVNKRASKQNGQWFSTYDRDHDLYCRYDWLYFKCDAYDSRL